MTRKEALVKFLGCEVNEIFGPSGFMADADTVFECGRQEYMVLLDSEADDKVTEYIKESVWAFNPEFLAAHAIEGIDAEVIKAIQDNDRCEGNNKALTALIKDFEHFVNDAVSSDGRGHFLNTYDGRENEMGEYFIYRLN